MKKFILVLVLFFGGIFFSYSQNYYNFNWNWGKGGNALSQSIKVTAKKQDGTVQTLISYSETNSSNTAPGSGKFSINTNSKIISIEANISYTKGGFGSNCSNRKTYVLNSCGASISLTCVPGTNPGAPSVASLTGRISPVKISPPSNTDSYLGCDPISIPIETSCGNVVEVDKWYYRTQGGAERYFPGHDGENPLVFQASEISNNSGDYINKPLKLRATFKYHPIDEIRNVEIISCSPVRTATRPTNTSCFGGNDGSVEFEFEKNIDSGNTMRFFFYEGTPPTTPPSDAVLEGNNPIINSIQRQTVLDANEPLTVTNGKYTWKSDDILSGGIGTNVLKQDYFVVYQELGVDGTVKGADITPKFTIKRPSKVNLQVVLNETATCTGQNMRYTLAASGGNNLKPSGNYSYTYRLGSGSFKPTSNSLSIPATTAEQTLTIKSAYNLNGCTSDNRIITIPAVTPAPVIANISGIPPSGPGLDDGSVTINLSGGTPPFDYDFLQFDGNTGAFVKNTALSEINRPETTLAFNGLSEGRYQLVVRQAGQTSCNVTSPELPLVANALPVLGVPIVTSPSCRGLTDASIEVPVSGGVAPYQFRWEDKNGNQIPSEFDSYIENLAPGDYTFKAISDGGSFTKSGAFVRVDINVPEAEIILITDVTANPTSCYGGNDGSLTITASGGADYDYSLDGGINWNSLIGNRIDNLGSRFYEVVLRKRKTDPLQPNCLSNISEQVFLAEPQEILTDSQIDSVTTNGGNNGSITLGIMGGIPFDAPQNPYTITWEKDKDGTITVFEDLDLTTPYTIVDLEAATYRAMINDASGCSTYQSPLEITVDEPGELVVTTAQTVFLDCNGNETGEITASVTGGVNPFTYEWFQKANGNNTPLTEDTGIIGNLSAGTYLLRVTDNYGISRDATEIIITQPDVLEMSIDNVTDVLCNGEETGAITFSVTGGTPPYRYFLNNELATNDNTSLAAGEYIITIYDDNGCEIEDAIIVNSPDNPLQIADVGATNLSEYQSNDGSIDLNIMGGLEPYAIDWTRLSDNVDLGNQNSISGLIADTYEVIISDANGCGVTATYKITQPDVVDETITQPTCFGDSNGSISLLVNRGNGSFTYSWSNGSTSNAITDLLAGIYTVTIDGFGDGSLTRTYIVEDPVLLDVNLGADRVLCQDQELVLDVTVADETATYEWTVDNIFLSSEPVIEIKETGNYTVILRTTTGCTATGSIFVETTTDEIDAEFAISSQVFVDEPFVAVDISYPLPENLEWVLPSEVTVVKKDNDEVELLFSTPGNYKIGIITTRGYCIAQQTKDILVVAPNSSLKNENRENDKKLIQNFIVYPNPSSGKFTADVNLTEVGNISIKVFSLTNNALMDSKNGEDELTYAIPFDLSGLSPGVYAILLETPSGNTLRKVILK